jgi:hypothetical protein
MTDEAPRTQMVTVWSSERAFTLFPVDSLPTADPEVSVTPWGEAGADDWLADHVRFSLGLSGRYAGMSISNVITDACAIAARLLTEAGLIGAATLHTLPIVDFNIQFLVRLLAAASKPELDA